MMVVQVIRELKAVGYFESGYVKFMWYHKPNVWHRFWYRFFLGWKWQDER